MLTLKKGKLTDAFFGASKVERSVLLPRGNCTVRCGGPGATLEVTGFLLIRRDNTSLLDTWKIFQRNYLVGSWMNEAGAQANA